MKIRISIITALIISFYLIYPCYSNTNAQFRNLNSNENLVSKLDKNSIIYASCVYSTCKSNDLIVKYGNNDSILLYSAIDESGKILFCSDIEIITKSPNYYILGEYVDNKYLKLYSYNLSSNTINQISVNQSCEIIFDDFIHQIDNHTKNNIFCDNYNLLFYNNGNYFWIYDLNLNKQIYVPEYSNYKFNSERFNRNITDPSIGVIDRDQQYKNIILLSAKEDEFCYYNLDSKKKLVFNKDNSICVVCNYFDFNMAVVFHNSKYSVIDSNFNTLINEYPCDGMDIIGENEIFAYRAVTGYGNVPNVILDRAGNIVKNLSESDQQLGHILPKGKFVNGLCPVSCNNKFGFINKNFEICIPLMYDDAKNFSLINSTGKYNCLSVVRINNKYGLIDITGNSPTGIIYDKIENVDNGIYICKNGNNYITFNFISNSSYNRKITNCNYDLMLTKYDPDMKCNINIYDFRVFRDKINYNGITIVDRIKSAEIINKYIINAVKVANHVYVNNIFCDYSLNQPLVTTNKNYKINNETTMESAVVNNSKIGDSELNFLKKYVSNTQNDDKNVALSFYGNEVYYQGEGKISKEKIWKEIQAQIKKWPSRNFQIISVDDFQYLEENCLKVVITIGFRLENSKNILDGKCKRTLELFHDGEDLKIGSEEEIITDKKRISK